MQAQDVKNCLTDAKVYNLFHANTVVTSLSYIKAGCLLSRQTTEDLGLPQSPQKTDESDKALGIYNDIFLDSVDVHQRAHRPNEYGPILFVYSIDVLDTLSKYEICVTKDNPERWNTKFTLNDRYFMDKDTLAKNFVKGCFSQHITIRNINELLPFTYLNQIIIDNPGESKKEHLQQAITSLQKALDSQKINVPVYIRECSGYCSCTQKYEQFKDGYTYYRFRTTL